MGRLLMCGAELGNSVELAGSTGDVTFDSTVKRSGAYALKIVSSPLGTLLSHFQLSFDAVGTAYFTVHVRFLALPASAQQQFFCVRSVTTPGCLAIRSDGKIDLYNQGGALCASGTTVLSTGTDYRIDLKIGKGAAGACPYELRINGVLEFSGSNGTFGTADIGSCHGGVKKDLGGAILSLTAWFDDVVIRDDSFEESGIVRVFGMIPNGNGDNGDKVWTGTPADTYADIDDGLAPDSDSSYWYATANGGKRCAALPSCDDIGMPAGAQILALQSWHQSRLVSGVDTSVGHVIRSGGYNFSQSYLDPGTGYNFDVSLWETDPATEEAWTRAGVDAAQVGVGISQLGLGNQARCTCMGVMVLVREVVQIAGEVTGAGSASGAATMVRGAGGSVTGVGDAGAAALMTAHGSAAATGAGTGALAAAVLAAASATATGRAWAAITAWTLSAGLATASGRATAQLCASVVARAAALATGFGAAAAEVWATTFGRASAAGVGGAICAAYLAEATPEAMARHWASRSMPGASVGSLALASVHSASVS